MATQNLLDTLGKKKGDSIPSPASTPESEEELQNAKNEGDVLKTSDGTGTDPENTPSEPQNDGVSAADADPEKDSKPDPYAAYSKEDALEELKKARAEAAKRRVENKDLEEQFQQKLQDELGKLEEKMAPLAEKAEKLDELKAKEEDRKRSLEDKVAHRDKLVQQAQEEITALRAERDEEKQELSNKINKLQSVVEAHETFYKEQLDKELAEVPAKFKNLADMIVKGAEDIKSALNAIRDAKKENLFGAKKVVVNHSVPGASTGARTDSVKMKEAEKKNLKTKDKYRIGLENVKSSLQTTKGGKIL